MAYWSTYNAGSPVAGFVFPDSLRVSHKFGRNGHALQLFEEEILDTDEDYIVVGELLPGELACPGHGEDLLARAQQLAKTKGCISIHRMPCSSDWAESPACRRSQIASLPQASSQLHSRCSSSDCDNRSRGKHDSDTLQVWKILSSSQTAGRESSLLSVKVAVSP